MWNQGIAIGTLTAAEVLIASFAACAICLKVVARRVLARFGIDIDQPAVVQSLRIASNVGDDLEQGEKSDAVESSQGTERSGSGFETLEVKAGATSSHVDITKSTSASSNEGVSIR